MNKKYIVVHCDEVTDQMRSDLKLSDSRNMTSIIIGGVESKYFVVSFNMEEAPNAVQHYKKFTKEQVEECIAALQAGQAVSRLNMNITQQSAFQYADGKRARFGGKIKFTIAAGETAYQEFTLTEDRLITGGQYKAIGANFGDKIDFEVMHPLGISLDKFIENWYVHDCQNPTFLEVYPAHIPAGLKIRITYYNTGANSVQFFSNFLLHKLV